MTRKNPAAVSLGRRGGRANTPAQLAARRANVAKAGRPAARGEPATERLQLYLTPTEMAAIRAEAARTVRDGKPATVNPWCVDALRRAAGVDDR